MRCELPYMQLFLYNVLDTRGFAISYFQVIHAHIRQHLAPEKCSIVATIVVPDILIHKVAVTVPDFNVFVSKYCGLAAVTLFVLLVYGVE